MRTNMPLGTNEQYVERLSREILDAYGLHDTPIIFRDRKGSTGGKTRLTFASGSVHRAMNGGWKEYSTVSKATGVPLYTQGQAGLHLLAIHECAHAIKQHQNRPGSAHGTGFIAVYREVLDKYPHPGISIRLDAYVNVNRNWEWRSREWCLATYKIGDIVLFEADGETVHGSIIRFNEQTMTVKGHAGCDDWRVHYGSHDLVNFRKFEIDLSDIGL